MTENHVTDEEWEAIKEKLRLRGEQCVRQLKEMDEALTWCKETLSDLEKDSIFSSSNEKTYLVETLNRTRADFDKARKEGGGTEYRIVEDVKGLVFLTAHLWKEYLR